MHRNEVAQAVINELDKVGLHHDIEQGGKHDRIVWRVGTNGSSKERCFHISRGSAPSSEWHAVENARHQVRRQLREDGLITDKPQPADEPQPPVEFEFEPPQPTIADLENQIIKLQETISTLTDLIMNVAAKLATMTALPVAPPEPTTQPTPAPIIETDFTPPKTQYEKVFEVIPYGDAWTPLYTIKRKSMIAHAATYLNYLKGLGRVECQPRVGWRRTAAFRKAPRAAVVLLAKEEWQKLFDIVPDEWTRASRLYRSSTVPNARKAMERLKDKKLVEYRFPNGSRKHAEVRRLKVEA